MATSLRHLLSSVQLGHTTAKNRIVSTPHGAAYGERGGLTDRYIRYHEEKAKGGCGVVMMFGSSSIHPTSVNDWAEINNWDDSIIPQFQQMSAAEWAYVRRSLKFTAELAELLRAARQHVQ